MALKHNGSGDAWEADVNRGGTPQNSLEKETAPASLMDARLRS